MERQRNKSILWESRVAELVLRITDRYQLKIVQVYAPTTSHSDEETGNFYNTIDKILKKQTHYTIVMGDFNAKVGGQTNTSERATGCFGLGQRNERGVTLVEWATSKNFKIMNTQFQKKTGRRWTWRSPDGNTKNEIDYIMAVKPSMVTDVTDIEFKINNELSSINDWLKINKLALNIKKSKYLISKKHILHQKSWN